LLMLNMQFDRTVVIDTDDMEWEASAMPGVWRKQLAHEAAEHGHSTSLVRYDPGSSFPTHQHPQGEEILVLEGVLSDEHGDYGNGTYIRNPPGSEHTPFSEKGCVLLVKRDQFDSEDHLSVCIDTANTAWMPGEDKIEVMPLHDFGHESVALYHWSVGARHSSHQHFGGEEIFVISGALLDEYGAYPQGSWIRNPHNSEHCPYVESETVIWIKTGHLLP